MRILNYISERELTDLLEHAKHFDSFELFIQDYGFEKWMCNVHVDSDFVDFDAIDVMLREVYEYAQNNRYWYAFLRTPNDRGSNTENAKYGTRNFKVALATAYKYGFFAISVRDTINDYECVAELFDDEYEDWLLDAVHGKVTRY